MELQCKERVGLLDALRKSRDSHKDSGNKSKGSLFSRLSSNDSSSSKPSPNGSPSLGGGTVEALQFPQLVRPVLPAKAAPLGPPDLTRKSSDPIRSRAALSSTATIPKPGSDAARMPPPPITTSRSPSPTKFVSTLRSVPKDYRAPSGRMVSSLRPDKGRPVAASAAAALAWPNGQQPRASMDEMRNPYVENLSREASGRQSDRRGVSLDMQRPSRGQLSPNPSGPQKTTSPQLSSQQFAYRSEYPAPTPVNPRKILTNNPPQTSAHLIARKAVPTPPTSPPAEMSSSSKQLGHQPEKHQGSLSRVLGSVRGRKPKNEKAFAAAERAPIQKIPERTNERALERAPEQRTQERVAAKAPAKAPAKTPARGPVLLEEGASNPAGAPGHASTRDVDGSADGDTKAIDAWDARVQQLMKNLPRGVDESAAKSIFNEIVIKGDEVHWDDVAGLDIAKNALKEAVVYPFLRPDLFLGLREPARGMLLFGPPGTGKTMLARAVATESRSTFFAISASSLTSKFLGESEKLVRALFVLAKALAPSIIFVDEIDSLLSSRSGSGEHEATRRIKTEFLIQWSDLAKAAAGKEQTEKEKAQGDATRVLVLAATNLPWAIDEAARRRFVRRQYIPLPEPHVRDSQLKRLLAAQKHNLKEKDMKKLITLTDGKLRLVPRIPIMPF